MADPIPTPKHNWTGPAAAVGAGVGAFAAIQALNDVPIWAQELIRTQGSDFLVAFVILGALIYFAPGFIKAQKDQAVALSLLADAVKQIANEGSALKDSMVEVSVNQGVIASRAGRLEEKLDGVIDKLDSLITKAGEGLGEKIDRLLEKAEKLSG